MLRRVAIDETNWSNATALAAVLPDVDAIIGTVASNSSEVIDFSASMDPGAQCSFQPDNGWVLWRPPVVASRSVYVGGVADTLGVACAACVVVWT